jgi:putative hemolysin
MRLFIGGKYRARLAECASDVARCQRLRHLAFFERRGLASGFADRRDRDGMDARCNHVMIEEAATGALVCCFRLLLLKDGSEIGASYAAGYYDLAKLARYPDPMIEMGRFCVDPAHRDPVIIRAAWRALGSFVEAGGVEMIFGCSSFDGTDAGLHADALARLAAQHLAPRRWAPRVGAPRVVRFAAGPSPAVADPRAAARQMPPLLRSYLALGAWVSDHAVVDETLGTLHVFTGVELCRLPLHRAHVLRSDAAA